MVDPKGIVVKNIMSKSVISVDASMTINEAAKMMEDTKVGAIIVMENNTPVGIVTDRDFAIKVVAHAYQISEPIKKIMSSPLIGIGPEETVWEAAELMKKKNIHKIPALENNKVIGIVTATDLVTICSLGSDSEMRRICDEILTRMQPK